MTLDAIALDDLLAWFQDKDHLRFISQRKDGGMAQAILRLEVVGIGKVIMGHVTFIAGGGFPVGAVTPGGVIG